MFCKNCGSQIEEGMKFCTNCGAPVEGNEEQNVQVEAVNENQNQQATSSNTIDVKSRVYKILGIVGFVFGILSLVFCWLAFGLVLSIPGIVLSIFGIKSRTSAKALGIIGLIFNILGLIASFVIVIVIGVLAAIADELEDGTISMMCIKSYLSMLK